MNIHEYQAKELLQEYGIPTLPGKVAFSPEEAQQKAKEIGGELWVVKAQIHAGGRGKAGGVILARSLEEIRAAANKLLGKTLVTSQTGEEGQQVTKVYIEQGCALDKEFYLSLFINRQTESVCVMVSKAGGMDIEEVVVTDPDKIITFSIDPVSGLQHFHARKSAFALDLQGEAIPQMISLMERLYHLFVKLDCSLIEINPLVLTKQENLIALDAKVTLDDNGLSRHPNIEKLRDIQAPPETQAHAYELNYVKLKGNIGCMVNGAGLAMATMDIIQLHGGDPANFLDVGGGATQEKVAAAFKLILADSNVQAILINIFGGIMRCDVIAEGIIAAAREVQVVIPMVVRLQGTNKELGKKILKESYLKIVLQDDFAKAAACVVQMVRKEA